MTKILIQISAKSVVPFLQPFRKSTFIHHDSHAPQQNDKTRQDDTRMADIPVAILLTCNGCCTVVPFTLVKWVGKPGTVCSFLDCDNRATYILTRLAAITSIKPYSFFSYLTLDTEVALITSFTDFCQLPWKPSLGENLKVSQFSAVASTIPDIAHNVYVNMYY